MKRGIIRLLLIVVAISFLTECGDDDDLPSDPCVDSDLDIRLDEVLPSGGCGVRDGVIRFSGLNGLPPYTYFVNDDERNDGHFKNVPSGIYTIRVEDSRRCIASLGNVAVMADGFSFSTVIVADTDCTDGNGSLAIDVLEGDGPFEFSVGGGPFSDVNVYHDLDAGEYSVVMRDAAECMSTLLITIPKGDSHTSWKDTIKPMVETHCATTGCHNGVSRPDLRQYDKAKFYASQMKTLTANGSMPFTGSLTKAQIALIACWVDEGARDN